MNLCDVLGADSKSRPDFFARANKNYLITDFKDWRFNCRPNNTESLLRLNIESKPQTLFDEKHTEIPKIVGGTPV